MPGYRRHTLGPKREREKGREEEEEEKEERYGCYDYFVWKLFEYGIVLYGFMTLSMDHYGFVWIYDFEYGYYGFVWLWYEWFHS